MKDTLRHQLDRLALRLNELDANLADSGVVSDIKRYRALSREQAEMAQLSFVWTKGRASQKTRDFLRDLPLERSFLAEGRRVKLFHAAPHKNNIYWYEDRPEKFFLEMAGKADADILVYGHTHKPYRKEMNGKTFVNAGSVGKPKDGDPQACLTVLEITPDAVAVDFIRVPYDVEKTAAAIVASGLPPYFAERLRKGT